MDAWGSEDAIFDRLLFRIVTDAPNLMLRDMLRSATPTTSENNNYVVGSTVLLDSLGGDFERQEAIALRL